MGGLSSRPAVFDIALYIFSFLTPIFLLGNWNLNMIQGVFFCFGTFALLGISFFSKQLEAISEDRKFIGFFILWSLINVFIHSFSNSLSQNIQSLFLNFCLMSEGFIFILCGSLLYWLIVSYKKNFNIAYPVLALNILNLFFIITQKSGLKLIWSKMDGVAGIFGMAPHMVIFCAMSIPILWMLYKPLATIPFIGMMIGHYGWGHSFSGVFALFVAVTLYTLIKKRYLQAGISLILGSAFIWLNWNVFCSKALIRFGLWKQTLSEITLFGRGWDNSMNMNMINVGNGFMYRHNDFLNLSRDLGLVFSLALAFFIIKKMLVIDKYWLPLAILLIGSMTWTSMYFPRLMVFGIILLALKEKECA